MQGGGTDPKRFAPSTPLPPGGKAEPLCDPGGHASFCYMHLQLGNATLTATDPTEHISQQSASPSCRREGPQLPCASCGPRNSQGGIHAGNPEGLRCLVVQGTMHSNRTTGTIAATHEYTGPAWKLQIVLQRSRCAICDAWIPLRPRAGPNSSPMNTPHRTRRLRHWHAG